MSITYPSGRIVTINRNAIGRISSITTMKNASASAQNIATGFTWRPMSELVSAFTYGNGLTFAATYDLDYRLATLKLQDGTANRISLAYAYGDGINLTGITDNVTAGNSASLGYNRLNRLNSANGPWGAKTFTYDKTGNLTQEVSVNGATTTRVLAYPATNNRVSSETTNGTTTRSFTYDGSGNTLTGVPQGATYAMVYNKRNRPSALQLNGANATTYFYNALEQLALRRTLAPLIPTGYSHYLYDLDGHLIAESYGATAASAVIVREYIWLEGMPIAVIDGVDTATPAYYVHTGHLMRPIRMTNAAKTDVWTATWTPWGTAHDLSGSALQNLRFPGQYFLMESGLYYNWHRVYDPTLGRYTQADPLGFPDGPARYAYAGNSPLMNVDPDGNDAAGAHAWASGQIGSTGYQYWDPNDQVGGKKGLLLWGMFATKCNIFAYDALNEGGDPPNLVDGHPPTTSDWMSGKVNNYSPIPKGSSYMPGDVLVGGGHMGLFAPLPGGGNGTISAGTGTPGFGRNQVLHNDWGFRNDSPDIYGFRCNCDIGR